MIAIRKPGQVVYAALIIHLMSGVAQYEKEVTNAMSPIKYSHYDKSAGSENPSPQLMRRVAVYINPKGRNTTLRLEVKWRI